MVQYIPDRGDLIWIEFDPQAGREQAGHRPAFVLSPRIYNQKVGLAICCPVTNQAKGYPFEVAIPNGLGVQGVVLADHLKSFDWRARNATFADKCPHATISDVVAKIRTLIY